MAQPFASQRRLHGAAQAYVDADATPEQRVQLAASVADKHAASLIGVSALAIPPPVVANGWS
jgi:hypothetical protein